MGKFNWKPDKLDIWWAEARIPEKEAVCKKGKAAAPNSTSFTKLTLHVAFV